MSTPPRMKSAPPGHVPARPLLREFGWHLVLVTVFNAGCAALITYPLRLGASFVVNLVFSLCIGTLALVLIDGTRLWLWGRDEPPKRFFLPLVLAAAPIAYGIGSLLAARIVGLPVQRAFAFQAGDAVILLLLTVVASLFAVWFFWNRGRLAALEASAEAEKARAAAVAKQAAQAQLQLLQAQIEPHMLFNTLANLQGMIAVDPAGAQLLLDQLIQYLRATLSSARAGNTTLEREFALMEAYLGLMSVRMGRRLSYTLRLPEALRGLPIAPMLLQPLVENAVRHGLEPKLEGGHIEVAAERAGGFLTLSVADTGLGLDSGAGPGTRLGLANVRERLLGLYGEAASLSLEPNVPAGALARLAIPLESSP